MNSTATTRMSDPTDDSPAELTILDEGTLLDYITGQPVKDTPKEQVRQRIGRALFHEYGISVEDMQPDFRTRALNDCTLPGLAVQ